MTETIQLLNEVYKNAEMGIDSLDEILELINSGEFKNTLTTYKNEYFELQLNAKAKLQELQQTKIEGVSGIAKVATFFSVNMKTMMDSSISHIAEMLIQGNNMGIITMNKAINQNPCAESFAIEFAEKTIRMQQTQIEELKQYL